MPDKAKGLPHGGRNEKKTYTIILAVVIILFTLATIFTKFNPLVIFKNQKVFWRFISEDFLPPDALRAKGLFSALLQTVEMALGATFIASCIAFALAFIGSGTTTPYPFLTKIVRAVGSFFRNIPALIWSFILVAAFGIGTSVGFIALIFETLGFLIRAFIEVVDEAGNEGLEALNAAGANFFQRIFQGIIPTALPGFISWFLYCIEVNIRSSTIVGMVGGGGIGLVLMSYIHNFKYHVAAAIILAIAALVILVDIATNWLRRRVLA